MIRTSLAVLLLGLAVNPAPAQTNGDKVLKTYTDADVERIVQQLDASFKKAADQAGNAYWDFKLDQYKVRLTNYGKDMMIDAIFGTIKMETANKWNQTAKFSRAVLYDNVAGNPYSAVEANLDALGGITENMMQQWIKRFGLEVKRYAKYVQKTDTTEKVYTRMTTQVIEDVMRDMNIKFRQVSNKNNLAIYSFTNKNNFNIRLILFGATDMMLSANFPETTLEKINGYNLKRKFIRAVLYQDNMGKYTALESNLDCVAGVSTSMIRYFINTFDVDVRDIATKLFNGRQN